MKNRLKEHSWVVFNDLTKRSRWGVGKAGGVGGGFWYAGLWLKQTSILMRL